MTSLKATPSLLALAIGVTSFAFASPANSNSSASTSSGNGGNFTVSDAAYAEVSALSYEALRQSANLIKTKLGSADTFIVIDRETLDSQIALISATAQLTNLNSQFCSAIKSAERVPVSSGKAPPVSAPIEHFDVALSAEGGSVLSGIASIAQLFTPHGSYASTAINPDDVALEDNLFANGTKIIVPSLYFPPAASIAPNANKAKAPCSFSYGAVSDAPADFPTLWLMANISNENAKVITKPSKDLTTVIATYNDLLKAYLTPQDKGGSLYSQMLRASAIGKLMASDLHPVFLQLGVDVMGGTTSESGRTSFDSKIRYSGGVVVHYLAWRNLPDDPMHVVAAGTITKTLSGMKIEDITNYLNTN
jgi:hypothetical protein